MSKRLLLSIATLLGGSAIAADDDARAQCAALEEPAARLACYDALTSQSSRPAAPALPAAPAVPAAPAGAPDDTDSFGKPAKSGGTLTARIVGMPKEWQRGTQFKLDNGQVWQSVDDSSEYYPNVPENPEIVITHGMLGYRMEIKAIRRRVWVKRIS